MYVQQGVSLKNGTPEFLKGGSMLNKYFKSTLATILLVNSVVAQELPTYSVESSTGIGITLRSFENSHQSLLSTFSSNGSILHEYSKTNRTFYDVNASLSLDGITFNENENKITLGVKAGFALVDFDSMHMGVGIDTDIAQQRKSFNTRLYRAIKIGEKSYFTHGGTIVWYRDADIGERFPLMGENNDILQEGLELGGETHIDLNEAKSTTLKLSGRGNYIFLPNSGKTTELDSEGNEVVETSNGGLINVSVQAVLKSNKVSLFVGTRQEFLKVKDFYKKTGSLSVGLFIPITQHKHVGKKQVISDTQY